MTEHERLASELVEAAGRLLAFLATDAMKAEMAGGSVAHVGVMIDGSGVGMLSVSLLRDGVERMQVDGPRPFAIAVPNEELN